MKSIIETSVYLIIMVLICSAGIDFVMMNMRISKVNEVAQYVEDYIEINSKMKQNSNENSDDGVALNKELDLVTINVINEIASKNDMKINYCYETETMDYIYWNIKLEYSIRMELFKLGRNHTYTMLARTQKEEGEL